jgi:hypothetical protein
MGVARKLFLIGDESAVKECVRRARKLPKPLIGLRLPVAWYGSWYLTSDQERSDPSPHASFLPFPRVAPIRCRGRREGHAA